MIAALVIVIGYGAYKMFKLRHDGDFPTLSVTFYIVPTAKLIALVTQLIWLPLGHFFAQVRSISLETVAHQLTGAD